MGWGNKAIEIRAAETGHLDGVFMHKKAQKLKFLCERNDKVSIFSWFVDWLYLRVRFMVFNTTFNNISVISWRSVLLLEETRVPGENYQPAACDWRTLSHNVVSSTPHLNRIQTRNVSGDRHWFHRWLSIQLPYDHDKWAVFQLYAWLHGIHYILYKLWDKLGIWFMSHKRGSFRRGFTLHNQGTTI